MRFGGYITAVMIMLVSLLPVSAQPPMGLYHMETIPQVSQLNPAMQPRANWFVALPWASQLLDSDLSFNTVFQRSGNNWITPVHEGFDYRRLNRATGNTINLNQSIEAGLFGFGFRRANDYFTLALSMNSVSKFGLPADLLEIAEHGFPDGSSYDFSTTRVKQLIYKELSLGYSRRWNDYLTLGVNLKPLFGMAGGVSNIRSLQLNTSRERFDMFANGDVYFSGPVDMIASNVPGEFPDSLEFRELDDSDIAGYLTSFSNPGLALDLGAVYVFDDNLVLSASLVNLGFISWGRDVNSISFRGSYSFDGIPLNSGNNHDVGNAAEAVVDSIAEAVIFETGHGRFITSLAPSLYLGASYNLTHNLKLGMVTRSLFQKHNFRQDLNVSANYNPFSFLALSLNYAVSSKWRNGIGAGMAWLIGPLQFYMVADYIPVRYAQVYFDDSEFIMFPYQRDLSLKVGLNLIFGRHGYRDEPAWKNNPCYNRR